MLHWTCYTCALALRSPGIFGLTSWAHKTSTGLRNSLSLSPIVSNLRPMHVSLIPTSTQLSSHTHSHTITCTHPLTNSDVLSRHRTHFFLFYSSYVCGSPLAQVLRRHTNTIMLAEDSRAPLSLNIPFTLITFYCLTILLKCDLCCAVTEREGNSLGWEEKRDASKPNSAQTVGESWWPCLSSCWGTERQDKDWWNENVSLAHLSYTAIPPLPVNMNLLRLLLNVACL